MAGIDTDSKGAIALLDSSAWTLDVYALPNTTKDLKSGKKRSQLEFRVLAATMAELTFHVDAVFLEDQWSRKSQDIGAMFGFGVTQGDIRTAVAAGLMWHHESLEVVQARMHFVSAADWKGAMGLTIPKGTYNERKALALERATAYFPDCRHAWKLTSKHTSAAEASLLACYGAAKLGIKLPEAGVIQPYLGPERTTYVRALTRID